MEITTEQFFEKPIKQINLRVTETEKNLIENWSKKNNISLNDFIRKSVLYFIEKLSEESKNK